MKNFPAGKKAKVSLGKMFFFVSETIIRFPKAGIFQASSLRQKLLPLLYGSWLKSYQVEFCANLSIGFADQEKIVQKCYNQMTTFVAYLLSARVQRLEKRAFLRRVWNALDLLGISTRSTSAMLLVPIYGIICFPLIFHIWKGNQ